MTDHACDYLIVGAGLAGASAVDGIRECDVKRSISIIGAEEHLPYDRPPLSKKLWFGKMEVKDVFLHDQAFYDRNGKIRGTMMCNVWKKVAVARELIRRGAGADERLI